MCDMRAGTRSPGPVAFLTMRGERSSLRFKQYDRKSKFLSSMDTSTGSDLVATARPRCVERVGPFECRSQ